MILMVAGEASGDLYGANLAREILLRCPEAQIFGIGGPRMKEAGVNLLHSIEDLAVVGIFEIIVHWKSIRHTFHSVSRFIKEKSPALVILIDYPDFNLRLAKIAKKEGIKVLYYISPQVWAWRKWRIKTIAKNVDTLLVVLPFEPPLYEGSGLDVRFIGHPLVDLVKPRFNREEVYQKLGVDPKNPVIGLLPGSRRAEIRHIFPDMLAAVQQIAKNNPESQFLLALAPTIKYADLEPYLAKIKSPLKIHCYADWTYDIIHICDLVLVASGTATLETALLNTPMILLYKLSSFTYLLAKLLVRVPHIGLVNLVAGERIVPELVQGEVKPEIITSMVEKFLQNPQIRDQMRQELKKVRGKLGEPGSSGRAAEIVLGMLKTNK